MTSFATESHNNSAMMMDEDELKELDSGDDFMYISVTDPNKMGEGMSSFMAYKVVTRTNSNYFKKKEMVVTRRFSDFLGLHDKLAEKYRQNGRIIPPAPDKSVVGMTKVKMTKDGDEIQDEVKILQFFLVKLIMSNKVKPFCFDEFFLEILTTFLLYFSLWNVAGQLWSDS